MSVRVFYQFTHSFLVFLDDVFVGCFCCLSFAAWLLKDCSATTFAGKMMFDLVHMQNLFKSLTHFKKSFNFT